MINHLGRVVVCVFNFEKALYFPGFPNNNEMGLCPVTERSSGTFYPKK